MQFIQPHLQRVKCHWQLAAGVVFSANGESFPAIAVKVSAMTEKVFAMSKKFSAMSKNLSAYGERVSAYGKRVSAYAERVSAYAEILSAYGERVFAMTTCGMDLAKKALPTALIFVGFACWNAKGGPPKARFSISRAPAHTLLAPFFPAETAAARAVAIA